MGSVVYTGKDITEEPGAVIPQAGICLGAARATGRPTKTGDRVAIEIELAATQEQFLQGAHLFRDYAKFLGVDLEFQGFSEELANLAHMYGPPKGALLLAKHQGCYMGV